MTITHPRKSYELRSILVVAALGGLLHTESAIANHPPRSAQPEAETLKASRVLKKITEAEWEQLASSQLTLEYQVEKGDTLTGISKRLFGDGKYWPKVWAINQSQFTNPHRILPGERVLFKSSSISDLPQVFVAQNASSAPNPIPIAADLPPGEWRKLPPQAWESIQAQIPPSVDANGFDRRSRVSFGKNHGWPATAFTTSEKITALGKVESARRDSRALVQKDAIFIAADVDLETGKTYALSSGPHDLEGSRIGRSGYAYSITGRVKIIGVRERLFVGELVDTGGLVQRGDLVLPLPPAITSPHPTAGSEALSATLLPNPESPAQTLAQHQLVYIDRGSKDGILPGMIFRGYAKEDGFTGDSLSDLNIVVQTDVQVVQSSEEFSTALVLRSQGDLTAGLPLVLLTDISEYLPGGGFDGAKIPATPQDLDELDQLDDGHGLTDVEKRELKQLEGYRPPMDGQISAPPPPPVPDAELSPQDLPPPPPPAELPPDGQSDLVIPPPPPPPPSAPPTAP